MEYRLPEKRPRREKNGQGDTPVPDTPVQEREPEVVPEEEQPQDRRAEYVRNALLTLAAVLALELVNSAIERAVDKPDTTHWWSAGAAKDMAAGAVLVMAVGTLIVALCVFWPRLGTLWANFTLRPTRPAGLVLTLVIFCKFIFRSSNSTEKGKQPNGKTDS